VCEAGVYLKLRSRHDGYCFGNVFGMATYLTGLVTEQSGFFREAYYALLARIVKDRYSRVVADSDGIFKDSATARRSSCKPSRSGGEWNQVPEPPSCVASAADAPGDDHRIGGGRNRCDGQRGGEARQQASSARGVVTASGGSPSAAGATNGKGHGNVATTPGAPKGQGIDTAAGSSP
jgi:hypothetical protein